MAYPIGTKGKAWGEAERAAWVAAQTKKRDYFTDVVSPLLRFTGGDVFQYGSLDYRKFDAATYPLYAAKSKNWSADKPMILVTGGVHGYETSGVHGALAVVMEHLERLSEKANVLVLPCVSPWGYETINRWTPGAVDPNRQFLVATPGCEEAALAMQCALEHKAKSASMLMHCDLHETTDSDNSEFIPAKWARDGQQPSEPMEIPDGFFLIAAKERLQLPWHEAMRDAVAEVTHVAEPKPKDNTIADLPVVAPGITESFTPGVCKHFSDAVYAVTTEVYPDSSRTNPEECRRAQVAAVTSGATFALQM